MSKKINIYFIITKEKPSNCGVYEYNKKLFSKFNNEKFNSFYIEITKWNIKNLLKIRKKTLSKSLIFINYPTINMGLSLSFLTLNLVLFDRKVFFNLHEFYIFSLYRKLIFFFLSFKSNFIFSNNHDLDSFLKYFPWSSNKTKIIPIASNIEVKKKKINKRSGLVFFGHIRKANGSIEKFLAISELIRQKSDLRISILGSIIDHNLNYKNYIRTKIKILNIQHYSEMPEEEISSYLSAHNVAFLPVKNGISEKKGSVLACLDHQLVVFSNINKNTPCLLKNLIIDTNNFQNEEIAEKIIKQNISNNHLKLSKNFKLYENYFSWGNVVKSMEEYFLNNFH